MENPKGISFEDLPETTKAYIALGSGGSDDICVTILKKILIRAWENELQLPEFWMEEGDIFLQTPRGTWTICANGTLEGLRINSTKDEIFKEEKREIGLYKLLNELHPKFLFFQRQHPYISHQVDSFNSFDIFKK